MTVGGKITRDSILYSWCVRREYFIYYESISKEMFRLVVSRVNEKAELCIFALCFALYGKNFSGHSTGNSDKLNENPQYKALA